LLRNWPKFLTSRSIQRLRHHPYITPKDQNLAVQPVKHQSKALPYLGRRLPGRHRVGHFAIYLVVEQGVR